MSTRETTRQTHDAYEEATGRYPHGAGVTNAYGWTIYGKDRTCAGCSQPIQEGATSVHPATMPPLQTYESEHARRTRDKRVLADPGYHPRCLPVTTLRYFTSDQQRRPSVTVAQFERALKAPRFRLELRPGLWAAWGGVRHRYSAKVCDWLAARSLEAERAAA